MHPVAASTFALLKHPLVSMRASPRSVSARSSPRSYVSAPHQMKIDDSEPPIIIIAPSETKEEEKKDVFDTSDCVYLIGSGAQRGSIVDDRLFGYLDSYCCVVGEGGRAIFKWNGWMMPIVGERRYLELILIGRYRWIVMVIVEDNLPSTMANIVARRLFIVNISRPTVPNIAYS